MSEEMFYITNRYAMVEEATLDTRERKKELGHMDQPSSSKDHDKKRKADHSVNAVEWPHLHKEYHPKLGEFKGFLDHICIFHPQGKHKTRYCDQLQCFADEILKTAKMPHKRRSPRIPRATSPKLTKRTTTSLVAPTCMSPKGSKNSQPERSWRSNLPPTSTLDGSRSHYFRSRYPLVIYPIVKDVRLNRVLIDGGSFINILFLKTFDQMGLSRSLLHTSWAPFLAIVLGAAATPICQISLPVTFGTRENF
jgi:hypothetical protein